MKFKELWNNEYFQTGLMLAITLIAVFAFWFGSRAALATEYPFLAVASGSMRPTLQVGDLIIVQGISNFSEVHAAAYDAKPPGDILVFHKPENPEELIVHRAIYKFQINGTWYFKTKGDNNISADRWSGPNGTSFPQEALPQDYVIGKVIAKIPWLGQIALSIREPAGLFIIVLLFFIILVIEFIPLLFSEKEDKERVIKNTSIYKGYINN
jgi:signal peptidase I